MTDEDGHHSQHEEEEMNRICLRNNNYLFAIFSFSSLPIGPTRVRWASGIIIRYLTRNTHIIEAKLSRWMIFPWSIIYCSVAQIVGQRTEEKKRIQRAADQWTESMPSLRGATHMQIESFRRTHTYSFAHARYHIHQCAYTACFALTKHFVLFFAWRALTGDDASVVMGRWFCEFFFSLREVISLFCRHCLVSVKQSLNILFPFFLFHFSTFFFFSSSPAFSDCVYCTKCVVVFVFFLSLCFSGLVVSTEHL